MTPKIKVTGKAQNRTALGIAHACLLINPETTIDQLRGAFPNSICPDRGVTEIFSTLDEAQEVNARMKLFFVDPDELITLADGSTYAMCQMWSKASLDRLIPQAAAAGIEAAEIDKTIKTPVGFKLEYLNGFAPTAKAAEKPLSWWARLLRKIFKSK